MWIQIISLLYSTLFYAIPICEVKLKVYFKFSCVVHLLRVTTPSSRMMLGWSNCPMIDASARKSRLCLSVYPPLRVLMATQISFLLGIFRRPLHTSPNSPADHEVKQCGLVKYNNKIPPNSTVFWRYTPTFQLSFHVQFKKKQWDLTFTLINLDLLPVCEDLCVYFNSHLCVCVPCKRCWQTGHFKASQPFCSWWQGFGRTAGDERSVFVF